MSRPARIRRGCLWALLVVALLVAFAPVQTIVWDGSFPDYEYRFRFVDGNNRPVPGVTLRVVTKTGVVCPFYPVNEFLPDSAPASDADGRMIFHHVSMGAGFGGRTTTSLVGIPLWSDGGTPHYDCVFMLDGREVHRARFDRLRHDESATRPSTTRTWKTPNWDWEKVVADNRHEWNGFLHRLFDGDGDGKFGREERIAIHAFEWAMIRQPREQDIEFPVVEHVITVTAR